VDAEIVKRLIALNREFYARFAREFSATRSSERLNLDPLKPFLSDGARMLDIGCGNGRLVARLEREGYHLRYLGVDVTPELIEMANVRKLHLARVSADFRVGDITARGWTNALAPNAPFDVVIALAVLHHVPGFELRAAVIRDVRAVLHPGGVFVMSNWRFMHNARLRRKIVPWQIVGMDTDALEEGDALLDWQRGGTGYRYCHQLTEAEVEALAASSGLQVVAQFHADADLNLYSILKAPTPSSAA
jgi:2-polyprenyl-3-methyl-5-hydroxy-6-metoxy-1,4-benzoquinol methylase